MGHIPRIVFFLEAVENSTIGHHSYILEEYSKKNFDLGY